MNSPETNTQKLLPEHSATTQARTRVVLIKRHAGLPLYLWLLLAVLAIGFAVYMIDRQNSTTNTSKPTKTAAIDKMDMGSAASDVEMVSLSDRSIVRAGVSTQAVESRDFSTEISGVGILRIPENNERMVTARARGRIVTLYANTTGAVVQKGKPLYDFYSTDILNAEQELLIARNSAMTSANASGSDAHSSSNRTLIRAGEKRLELLGMSRLQIDQLESSSAVADHVTILAPQSGVVIQKFSEEGAFVEEGSPLFQLADLSTLWAEIDIPESYIHNIAIGQMANIKSESYGDKTVTGKVIFISPIEDQSTRTISVRVALQNPGMKLRPAMTFSAAFPIHVGKELAVPVSAVIRTGKGDFVWLRDSGDMFRSHQVTLGARSPDDYYEVLAGLVKGQEVAMTGAFMIDAEHEITKNNPMATMHMSGGDQGSKNAGEGTGTVRAIDAKTQMITLDHGNIPKVMAAMTMAYKVSVPAELNSVKTNEQVRFTLTRMDNGEYYITSIQPLQ